MVLFTGNALEVEVSPGMVCCRILKAHPSYILLYCCPELVTYTFLYLQGALPGTRSLLLAPPIIVTCHHQAAAAAGAGVTNYY